MASEWLGSSRLPGRWRRRPPAWAGRRGRGAGGGRGRRGGAGGRGRAGGGPRRPALPAAAILSSEEEEEEEAPPRGRGAPGPGKSGPGVVATGAAVPDRGPRGGLGPGAHVGRPQRALSRRLGPPTRTGAARPRPHFLGFPAVSVSLRRMELVPRWREEAAAARLPEDTLVGGSGAVSGEPDPLYPPTPSPAALRWTLCFARSVLAGVLAMASSVCGVVRGGGLGWGCGGVVIQRNKMTLPPPLRKQHNFTRLSCPQGLRWPWMKMGNPTLVWWTV